MKFAAIVGVLMVGSVFGNGGGYFRNGVRSTGDIMGFEPENTEKIAMVDEKLTVSLGSEKAEVEIVYLLKNVSDEKVKVRFGFPVEETRENDHGAINFVGEDEQARITSAEKNLPAYCEDYRLLDGGKEISTEWKSEPSNEDGGVVGISGWLVTEVKFAAGEEKVVRISFASHYSQDRSWVSDDSSDDEAVFKYRLSTAACWAGPIKTGRIVFKADGIHPDEVRVIKPANRFKKEGDDWVWSFQDLEPTLQDDIEVEAVPSVYETRGYLNGKSGDDDEPTTVVERGESWFARHSNYKVTASSVLPVDGDLSYAPDNLKTWWNLQCWAEGAEGNGAGEWLEFAIEVPKPLHAIYIHSGYYKEDDDKTLFNANARPKSVKVELNGEHEFTASLEDVMAEQMIAVTGYAKPVKTVRLTVMDVYPGSAYEDLCISAVSFLAKLDKKPELSQSR